LARIAIITQEYLPYPGGVARYCAELSDAAAARGHQVTVFAPSYLQTADDRPDARVNVVRFPGDTFRMSLMPTLNLLRHLQHFLRHNEFDVIHAADWPVIIALNLLRPLLRRSSCYATLYGTDVLLLKQSARARLLGARSALAAFSTFVPISAFTKGLLLGNFPALGGRDIRIAPLGVAPSWFDRPAASEVAAFRGKCGLNETDRIVLTVARLERRKGHLTAIEALAQMPEALKRQVAYVCIGRTLYPEYEQQLRARAEAGGVNLVFTGRLTDRELLAAYAGADVFCLTAEQGLQDVEGFGLVLLEAAAQGLPSVVTKVHAIPEVIEDSVTGWIAPDADIAACSARLTRALQNGVPAEMRQACIAHARSFTWDRCAAITYA
jgi:glycosyltransferase involved in cell wall biosynthesis